jgi:hypothetical protein
LDVELTLLRTHQIRGPEGLVVPEWVIDLRNELFKVKGATCPDLANRMSVQLKQSDHPFLYAMLMMSWVLRDSEAYLQDHLLDDVVLRQLLMRHVFSDPRPVLADCSRRFLFKLSNGQGDEFNIALHKHFTLSPNDLKLDSRRTFNSILLCHLPTTQITQAVQAMALEKRIHDDKVSESTLLNASLRLLAEHPTCSYGTHDHLLSMIEVNNPTDEVQTKALIKHWRQVVRMNQPVVPAHRFLLLEIYGLLVEEHVFSFSGVHDRDIPLALKDLMRNEGLLSPGQLAKATHTPYGMQVCKELLTCPQQLNDYLSALEGTELLTSSLEQDLGL